MRERLIGPLIALLVVLVGAGCAAGAQVVPPQAAPERSNVVFILADDLSADALNRNLSEYPNIKALAASGVSFTNSFVTDPVCCPSRATNLTGMYKHNHGVDMDNQEPAFRALDDRALPVWLDGAGYTTGYFGKYLNGYQGDHTPPGWDVWRGTRILRTGTDTYLPGYDLEGRNDEGRTHTQVFAEQAAGFVKGSSRPFFAYVAPYAPHEPAAHPHRYDGLFTGARAPRTPSFNERDVSDKPRWVRARARLSGEQIKDADATYRDMLRSTKDVDDLVGRVVAALRESGELDNTYVVFTSDNGFHLGQHRLDPGKWTAYEEDIRVPLVVRGPGVPAGVARSRFALNNDLAPTFADWAGVEPSEALTVDGRSLAPLLSSEAPPTEAWRDAFLVEAIKSNEKVLPRPAFKAIRTRGDLYVEYAGGERELYDLARDPHELQNLAGKGRPIEAQLSRRLDALKPCGGTSCRTAEGS